MCGSRLPEGVDGDELSRIVEGVCLARDLINTPANDMGPPELEQAARALAEQHGASVLGHRRRRSAASRISRSSMRSAAPPPPSARRG